MNFELNKKITKFKDNLKSGLSDSEFAGRRWWKWGVFLWLVCALIFFLIGLGLYYLWFESLSEKQYPFENRNVENISDQKIINQADTIIRARRQKQDQVLSETIPVADPSF